MQASQMMVQKLLLLRDIQELCCLAGGQSDPSLLLFRRVPPSDELRERTGYGRSQECGQ